MQRNIGTVDRVIRVAAAVVIGLAGVVGHSWLGLIAFIPLATAAVGVCPLYLPFGINTRKRVPVVAK